MMKADEVAVSTRGAAEYTGVGYRQPEGVLFWGISPNGYTLKSTLMTGPAYSTWKFTNTTTGNATYQWIYEDSD